MDRPLRLALVTIEYPPDPLSSGIGSYTAALAAGLAGRGHRVHVVARAFAGADPAPPAGVTVHRVGPVRPALPDDLGPAGMARLALRGGVDELRYRRRVAASIARLVDEEGVDLVEAAEHVAEPMFYRPRRRPRVPFVVRLHTPLALLERLERNVPEPLRLAVRALERDLMARATHLSAPTAAAAGEILAEMGLDRPVTVVPNPPTFPPARDAPAGAEAETAEAGRVLFVGRLSRFKGADTLVRALPRLVAARPDARLRLVGSDHLTVAGRPVREHLLSLAPAGLRDLIELVGHLPHERLAEELRRASVVALPSWFESFGYTCLEAMTFGKAIVGSSRGGMVDLLDEGRAGLLVPPGDEAALADALARLLGDAALRRELGARARARARERYGLDAVLDETVAFYRRAVAERRAAADG